VNAVADTERGPERESGQPPLHDAVAADFNAWRDGEPAALERLVVRLTPVLWHLARAYGLDRATAEDVVQTTWLTLYRKADTIQDPQAVLRWLSVTTRREAGHRAAALRHVDLAEDNELESRSPVAEDPAAVVTRSDRDAALWRAVQTLSERCQRLLRVIAFSERPNYRELSEELGMPVGSIGPTRGRCLDKLREALGSAAEWSTS
jgi:RNA polymerase sigma factor (sigma-70 family)